eukprot:1147004-Pelagomonas_calceolata.AAC.9
MAYFTTLACACSHLPGHCRGRLGPDPPVSTECGLCIYMPDHRHLHWLLHLLHCVPGSPGWLIEFLPSAGGSLRAAGGGGEQARFVIAQPNLTGNPCCQTKLCTGGLAQEHAPAGLLAQLGNTCLAVDLCLPHSASLGWTPIPASGWSRSKATCSECTGCNGRIECNEQNGYNDLTACDGHLDRVHHCVEFSKAMHQKRMNVPGPSFVSANRARAGMSPGASANFQPLLAHPVAT